MLLCENQLAATFMTKRGDLINVTQWHLPLQV